MLFTLGSKPFTMSYVLPFMGAISTKVIANTSNTLSANNERLTIDVRPYNSGAVTAGMYIVKLQSGNAIFSKKLIKN